MATKKKKSAARKKTPPRKPAPRRVKAAPVQLSAPSPAPQASSSSMLGGVLIIVAILVLAWFFMHRQPAPVPAPAAAAAPFPTAAGAAGAPPEARSVAPAAPKAEAKAVPAHAAAAHRESAGEMRAPLETGAPSLTFDRAQGPLSVRCWRTEGGMASLDIFAPKNRAVRSLKSEAGPAGLVELSWDGKDAAGKKVPTGLYFLRPTQKDEQSIRDVWVK